MSSNLAYARPNVQPATRPAPSQRPHIEIAPSRAQRKARPRAVYAVVTVASLFLIFAAQLLLSIVVSDGAYQIDSLQSQQKGLLRTEQALGEKFDLLDSTQHLAQNAAKLGMVPTGARHFIDLGTGAVTDAPGTADPTGCGGACNLVANSLLTGVPLTAATAPKAQTSTAAPSIGAQPTAASPSPASTDATPPGIVDTLPAPVTH